MFKPAAGLKRLGTEPFLYSGHWNKYQDRPCTLLPVLFAARLGSLLGPCLDEQLWKPFLDLVFTWNP